ncbi:MAG: transcriptional regulator [Archaeoglobaceae archaeon]|nr:transcriptional regulator [Archaeoglobaceae archaeon]MDW7989761.1 transcriptional regulator [Archaeoglobaceae archaeon]
MKPHCIYIVKYVLPALRAMVARELLKRGFRMKDVAEMLGLTQAAVSQYISYKRGQKGLKAIEKNENIRRIVMELTELIAQGKAKADDGAEYLCRICESIRSFEEIE